LNCHFPRDISIKGESRHPIGSFLWKRKQVNSPTFKRNTPVYGLDEQSPDTFEKYSPGVLIDQSFEKME
jgi:hypothetical protein